MRSTLKAGIIEAVQQCPGIGVADLAVRLGADKGNVRRFTLELERDGKLVARKDADGYRFFPVGFAMPDRKNAVDHYQPQVIDAEFRVIDPVRASHSGGGPRLIEFMLSVQAFEALIAYIFVAPIAAKAAMLDAKLDPEPGEDETRALVLQAKTPLPKTSHD